MTAQHKLADFIISLASIEVGANHVFADEIVLDALMLMMSNYLFDIFESYEVAILIKLKEKVNPNKLKISLFVELL